MLPIRLTPNFKATEFDIHERAPAEIRREKLPRVALLCQWLRDLAGGPGLVQSYWRSPERNALVGGALASQHMTGEAADIEFFGISLYEHAKRCLASIDEGTAPAFGQLIFYVDTGHVHISLPRGRKDGQLLIGEKRGGVRRYRAFDLAALPTLPNGTGMFVLLAASAVAAAVSFPFTLA